MARIIETAEFLDGRRVYKIEHEPVGLILKMEQQRIALAGREIYRFREASGCDFYFVYLDEFEEDGQLSLF